jgi:hypothetical protein
MPSEKFSQNISSSRFSPFTGAAAKAGSDRVQKAIVKPEPA